MNVLTKASLLGAALATTLAGVVGAAAPAHATSTVHGCPYGYVCVYPQDKGWNNDVPSLKFYTYGGHNLSNQFGNHYVLNNQYSQGHSAVAVLCSGFGGCTPQTSSSYDVGHLYWTWDQVGDARGSSWASFNLTPVNSIDLETSAP